MTELKPCPLCGGNVIMDIADVDCDCWESVVACEDCGLQLGRSMDDVDVKDSDYIDENGWVDMEDTWEARNRAVRRELTDAWNRRVSE